MHWDETELAPPPTALIVYSGRICMRQSRFPTLPCCLSSCWHVAIKISLQITPCSLQLFLFRFSSYCSFSLSKKLIWAPCSYHFELPTKSGKLDQLPETFWKHSAACLMIHSWIIGELVNGKLCNWTWLKGNSSLVVYFLPVDHITLQGAGHNDVELYNQYLERLKTFVSTELTNWRGPKDPKSPELLNAKKLEEEEKEKGGRGGKHL